MGAYLVLIFGLSSIPHLTPPGNVTNADKIAHFIEYGILGVLLFRALAGSGLRPLARVGLAAFVVGVMIAGLDELYQGTVGRDRSVGDWSADAAGLAAAVLAGVLRGRGRGPEVSA